MRNPKTMNSSFSKPEFSHFGSMDDKSCQQVSQVYINFENPKVYTPTKSVTHLSSARGPPKPQITLHGKKKSLLIKDLLMHQKSAIENSKHVREMLQQRKEKQSQILGDKTEFFIGQREQSPCVQNAPLVPNMLELKYKFGDRRSR